MRINNYCRFHREALLQIVWSALGSVLFAAVGTALMLVWQQPATQQAVGEYLAVQLAIPVWLFVSTHALLGVAVASLIRREDLSPVRGRHLATKQHVDLLRERSTLPPAKSLICSTRMTCWPLAESSVIRASFREELDRAAIHEGREIRRIWNVNDADDARRLEEVVHGYQGCRNVSIRAYFDIPSSLPPEVIVVNDLVASLSFPQLRNPTGVEAGEVTRHPEAVLILRQYFDVLWHDATPILTNGDTQEAAIRRARKFTR